jgi:hypothetical protein
LDHADRKVRVLRFKSWNDPDRDTRLRSNEIRSLSQFTESFAILS